MLSFLLTGTERDRTRSAQSSKLRALSGLSLLLAACGAEAPVAEETGTIGAALVTTAADGTPYRLRTATLTITGPQNATLVSNDTDPNETLLTANLPVGSYTASLAPNWSLARLDTTPPTAVTATLLSPNPATFTITSGGTTTLTLAFQTDGGVLQFNPGTLNVNVNVAETTPSLPVLTTQNFPTVALDLAAGPNRAYVVTQTGLFRFAPNGTQVFQVSLPSSPSRAVLADGNGAIVVTPAGANSFTTQFFNESGVQTSTFSTPTPELLQAGVDVCLVRGPNNLYAVVLNEGTAVRARVYQGTSPTVVRTSALLTSFASPVRCAAFFKNDGAVVFGGNTAGSRIALAELSAAGSPIIGTQIASGVTGRFQLASDGTPNGFFASWGGPQGLQVARFDSAIAGAQVFNVQVPGGQGAVNALMSGSFFGRAGTTAVVAGQVGSAFLGSFSSNGVAVSDNRDAGTVVLAADAAAGTIWAIYASSQPVLRTYPM
jgi:hypothetical protein